MDYYKRALELNDETVKNRRYFHTNAETGLHMPMACAYVMDKLTKYGLTPSRCGEGVTATVAPNAGRKRTSICLPDWKRSTCLRT